MNTDIQPSQEDMHTLALRLGSVFSPATPVSHATLFAGRRSQLEEISDSVSQRGLHTVLFGERGVGKTSLANVFPEFLRNAGIDDLIVSKVNCDSTDNFSSIWRKALREIQISMESPSMGFAPHNVTTSETLDLLLQDDPSPEDIRYLLQRVGGHPLLVIDEYDRLEDGSVSRLMADTIKALSDHSVNATIILVGVADTVDELIAEHQSIDRCLVQVHMPRMSMEELADILDNGLVQVGMEIADTARFLITFLSQGLPHYTHLLGLIAARLAVGQERLQVIEADAEHSIRLAVHQAQQSTLDSYTSATSSSRKDNLFKQVLLSCALAPTDELGFFTARDVSEPMSRIMGKPYRVAAFARHLEQFCKPERGPVLQKQGVRRRYRYRFINPLLQPYVLFHGLSHRLITIDSLERKPN